MAFSFQTEHIFLECIKPAVRQMSAYTVEGGQYAGIKLNQNENPFDLPEWLKREILERFLQEPWNRYPSTFADEAVAQYANFIGVPKECVMMGNGSNELIYTIFLAILRRTASVLIPAPSFSLYDKVAALLEAEILHVAMTPSLEFDTEQILEEAERSAPALIVLSTANNPTSRAMKFEDIARIASETRALVLVDEAYAEFSRERSALELLETHPNVIVLRTLSKAFSLAGLRIGFAISNPALMAELRKPKIPFASSRLAEIAVIKILEHYSLVQASVKQILSERARLLCALREIPRLRALESDTNFIIIQVEQPKQLFEALRAKGILVRDVSKYPLMEKCLRISVGTPEENDHLLSELRQLCA
ncbi:MAG: histidinol-phosphate transaminase [Chloroherpetonaceae bacterium]|nr:histidinol-phosphate transaminase [Chloroherpetonaceae bacterium]MCS7211795.1 histidinol-phosphate transaminase [Chloroherpetonaceae bacterium]MDW8020648.1 histidinol-phosphate transaminase [Chloroherpetonaceae bacterium]